MHIMQDKTTYACETTVGRKVKHADEIVIYVIGGGINKRNKYGKFLGRTGEEG
jgi:hypothetical protein